MKGPGALGWIARYARVSPAAAAHLAVRFLGYRHFERIERLLPPAGRVLDLGCGHGLLSVLAASREARREVLGIDLFEARLRAGRRVAMRHDLSNARFEAGDIRELPPGPFDAVVVMDVLLYLPFSEQRAVLRRAVDRLAPGGVLLVDEQVTSPRWKARLVALEERLAYQARVGLGTAKRWGEVVSPNVWLWDPGALEDDLRALGLETQTERHDAGCYLSHRLFVGRRGCARPRAKTDVRETPASAT